MINRKDASPLQGGQITAELKAKMEEAAKACACAVTEIDKVLSKPSARSETDIDNKARENLRQQKKAC